jgi:hypothetical protein
VPLLVARARQDGIVHIESPIAKTFLLGQAFAVWQQLLSSTQVGPYKGTVRATVNGVPWIGDPSLIPLDEHTHIVLNLGGPVVTPPPISWSGSGSRTSAAWPGLSSSFHFGIGPEKCCIAPPQLEWNSR